VIYLTPSNACYRKWLDDESNNWFQGASMCTGTVFIYEGVAWYQDYLYAILPLSARIKRTSQRYMIDLCETSLNFLPND
jgi:hypothetical protein